MVHSGETSDRTRKRGRPIGQLSTEDEKQRKYRKKIADKKSRDDNRAVVVGLTEIAPLLLKLVEVVGSGDGIRQFLAGVPHIEDAIARFKELALVDQSNLGELQQKQGQNITWSIQEIQAMLNDEAPVAFQDYQFAMSNDVAPDALQDSQNFAPQTAVAEQLANGCNRDMPMGPLAEFGNNEPITRCPTSSDKNGRSFDGAQVKIFFDQFEGKTKRQVKYSDFNGLLEELNKVGHNVIPSFLTLTAEKIKKEYGDIAEDCTLSDCAIYPTRIMLYVTIKEIDELKDLKDVSMAKLEVWRDAIIDAQQFKFNVEFANFRLKKIAYAYFASKPHELYERKKKLEAELDGIKEMIELHSKCEKEATYFTEKPLNAGLFSEKQT